MRKRCIRKHYAKVDPIALAISGTGTPADFRDLCDMLNLAQTMGEMGIGPEVLLTCEAVELVLVRAKEFHDESKRLAVTPGAIILFRDLYEFHDLQRTSVDRSTYERAIQKTRNRIRSAHPDVKELV